MQLFLTLLLLHLVLSVSAGYIAIFGGACRTVAHLNETSGETKLIGEFKVTKPRGAQLWIITTLKSVDPLRRRVYFSYEDVTKSMSATMFYDLDDGSFRQGPTLYCRLRSMHFDVKQRRLFVTTDYEMGVSDATILELNPETMETIKVVANLNHYGSPNMASAYDQIRGIITLIMYHFGKDTYHLISVEMSSGMVLNNPQITNRGRHILTLEYFEKNGEKLVALWNVNNYTPLLMQAIDRKTAQFDQGWNTTVIDWPQEHDSMTTDAVPFAKDDQHGHLFACVTGKTLNQYLVLIDLVKMQVLFSKLLEYPHTVGYDMTPVYVPLH